MKAISTFLEFENYSIFEDSTLSKIGIPKSMITAIHTKEEHRSEKYKKLGRVHRKLGSGENDLEKITIPYSYYRPSHDESISTPKIFTGVLVPPPPGSTRKSSYPDFAQFLQDLPNGPLRVLITRAEDEIFVYLYSKERWGGGPTGKGEGSASGGQQYALIVWDRDQKKAIDYGFHELTFDGVKKELVRLTHEHRGGNTNQKLQEYVNRLGNGAPKKHLPIRVYTLDPTPAAREKRESRSNEILSIDLIRVFANRFGKVIPKLVESRKAMMISAVNSANSWISSTIPVPSEVEKLATSLKVTPEKLMGYLVYKLASFRKELWEEGVGKYAKQDGFSLEKENNLFREGGLWNVYTYSYAPDPEDTRHKKSNASSASKRKAIDRNKPDHLKGRKIPEPGDYASVESLIEVHSLDGTILRFAGYCLTNKIFKPDASFAGLLGLDLGDELGSFL
jgi:hypothetical protein